MEETKQQQGLRRLADNEGITQEKQQQRSRGGANQRVVQFPGTGHNFRDWRFREQRGGLPTSSCQEQRMEQSG